MQDKAYDFTMSTDFSLTLIKPNNLPELNAWFSTIPFQTLTAVLHHAYPDLRGWDITSVPYSLQLPQNQRTSVSPDPDGEIWTTYVWRKTPPPMNIETYYRGDVAIDVLGECRVVFAVQPPWVLSEADIDRFIRTEHVGG